MQNGDNTPYFIGLLKGLKEIIHVRAQDSVRSRASSGTRAIRKIKEAFCESVLVVITRFTARGCYSGAERLSQPTSPPAALPPSLVRSIRV